MQKNRSEKISSFGISESVGSLQRSHNRETILLMNEYTLDYHLELPEIRLRIVVELVF